jgi:hypothetical protein
MYVSVRNRSATFLDKVTCEIRGKKGIEYQNEKEKRERYDENTDL